TRKTFAIGAPPTNPAATWVAVADVNGDSALDIVTADNNNAGNLALSVLLGNGNGTFHLATSYNAGGKYPSSVAIGDLNGDGKPDLVDSFPYASGSVNSLIGNGDGSFQSVHSIATALQTPSPAIVADVNGDGKLDIDFAQKYTNAVSVVL